MRDAGHVLEATQSREILSYWCEFAARALLDEGDPATALRLLVTADELRSQLGLVSWANIVPFHTAMIAEATGQLEARADGALRDRPADAWQLMSDVLAAHPAPAV